VTPKIGFACQFCLDRCSLRPVAYDHQAQVQPVLKGHFRCPQKSGVVLNWIKPAHRSDYEGASSYTHLCTAICAGLRIGAEVLNIYAVGDYFKRRGSQAELAAIVVS
jgi:hypothetical protein